MWRTVCSALLSALLLQQPQQGPWLPSDSVRTAAADLRSLPAERRPYARYLTLGCEWEETELEKAATATDAHVNLLSRSTIITRLVRLAGNHVLRLDVRDYGKLFATQWERLADVDPYYHEPAQGTETILWPGGTWRDGLHYEPATFTWKRPKVQLARILSEGKDGLKDALYLVKQTQSRAPIIRADWFFNQTAVQFRRAPGYYDFLGIKDEASFEKLIGVRKKEFIRVELRESVARSSVTHEARALVREDAEGGFRWRSLDFIRALGKRDPLENAGRGLDRQADATEQYGTLPNLLPVTLAANGKGVRQDFAPAEIAADTMSTSTDKKVHVNASCLRCHAASGQLQPIKAWHRNLMTPPFNAQIADVNARKAYKASLLFREQYGRDLEKFLVKDRLVYADAIKEATGWSAQEFGNNYAWMWERYEDAEIGTAYAARDLGVTIERFRTAIDREIRAVGRTSPSLAMFLLEGERAQSVKIRQWEVLQRKAQLTIRGYIEP